jgi:hypothetical protein
MAKSTSLFLPKNANNQSITLTSADTSVAKFCFTAGADDSNVKAILATTNDTATINLAIYLTRGAVDYLIGTVNVPVASGTNGSAGTVDLLSASAFPGLPLDNVGKRYIPMKTGDTLKIGAIATMTAAKTCWVSVLGEDY